MPKNNPTQKPKQRAQLKSSSKNLTFVKRFLMGLRMEPYFKMKTAPININVSNISRESISAHEWFSHHQKSAELLLFSRR